ncbi:hypothetical protein N566_06625 [Streptomycetaceae bacterium MP113-05]|nr:hypothetical protein N566_06625 [Streptomycetaceae bacterium MP113-05]
MRVVVAVVAGESPPAAAEGFLLSMRLSCRGVRVVNLGAGMTLEEAVAQLGRHRGVQALLLVCAEGGAAVERRLHDLPRLRADGAVTCPVFAGGVGAGVRRDLRRMAPALRRLGVAQVLNDLADTAYLLPAVSANPAASACLVPGGPA